MANNDKKSNDIYKQYFKQKPNTKLQIVSNSDHKAYIDIVRNSRPFCLTILVNDPKKIFLFITLLLTAYFSSIIIAVKYNLYDLMPI